MRPVAARGAGVIRVDAVWLATEPLDMRAGIDSALARVVQVFGAAHPHTAYLFANRPANRMKVFVHDGIGFWLATPVEQAKILLTYTDPDLLVLDDLFLARRMAEVSAELLQAIVHQRYKLRRSIVVTSNRVVQDWGKYLGDATMGSTILDRLMHRSSMLDFEGKSYRLREAAARMAAPAPTDS